MAFQLPPFVTYNTPVVCMPSRELEIPLEGEGGRQYAPITFDWGAMGNTQYVDLGQLSTRPFNRICTMDVDNSANTCDVKIWFPDTQTTIEVAAGAFDRLPATTSSVRFYIGVLQEPNNTDTTRVTCLNYYSQPYSNPIAETAESAAVADIDLTAGNTVDLIAPSISGILDNLFINQYTVQSGVGAGEALLQVSDGLGTVLALAGVSAPASAAIPSGAVLQLSGFGVRFTNGVQVSVLIATTPLTNGAANITASYKVAR